jgi:hypothetical protein
MEATRLAFLSSHNNIVRNLSEFKDNRLLGVIVENKTMLPWYLVLYYYSTAAVSSRFTSPIMDICCIL